MKYTSFLIPYRMLQADESKVVFRQAWQGQDMFWIVPMLYVIRLKLKNPDTWDVKISEAFFELPINRKMAA